MYIYTYFFILREREENHLGELKNDRENRACLIFNSNELSMYVFDTSNFVRIKEKLTVRYLIPVFSFVANIKKSI